MTEQPEGRSPQDAATDESYRLTAEQAAADFAADPADLDAESRPADEATEASQPEPDPEDPEDEEGPQAAVSEPPEADEPEADEPEAEAEPEPETAPAPAPEPASRPVHGSEHGERWHADAHPSRLPPAARPCKAGA